MLKAAGAHLGADMRRSRKRDEGDDGRLPDGADYTVAVPEKTSGQEHWQIAVHQLMLAAERGGTVREHVAAHVRKASCRAG
jgi:hypothetical protein